MHSRRAPTVLALLAMVVVAGIAPAVATAQPATDTTVTRITVQPDGDATWTLEVRTRLESQSDVAAFERFQADFSENTSAFLGPYRDRMRTVVAGATADSQREMAARNFSADTSIQATPRQWGVVTYRFEWVGFAEREGDALVVGDVFGNGLFLTGEDTLEIVGPAGYTATEVGPTPDRSAERTVTWRGERDFADGRPRVRFEPRGSGLPVPGGIAGLALLLLVLGGGVAAAYVGYSRRQGNSASTAATPATAGTGDEPVTDTERVRQLLDQHGGRMKQHRIVEELGWSKSKVSRRLSSMEAEGTVSRVKIGRENVVELED